jgi:serine O-acetyltransferase
MAQRDEIIPLNSRATAGPRDKKELRHYLAEDLQAHGITRWRWHDRFRFPVLHFQAELRKTEYVINTRKGRLGRSYASLLRYRLQRMGIKLGFTIPPNVFGPGLSIAHWGTIVINEDCRRRFSLSHSSRLLSRVA